MTAKKTKTVKLDNIVLRNAKPGARFNDLSTVGLSLDVSPKGLKTWFMRVTVDGEQIPRYKIGTYPNLGIADARRIAEKHHGMAYQGINPKGALTDKVKTRGAAGVASWSFADLLDAFCDDKAESTIARSGEAYKIRRNIENHIFPHIPPTIKAVKITFAMCIDALEPLAKHRPALFKVVQKHLRQVINFMSLSDDSLRDVVLKIDTGEFSRKFKKQTKNTVQKSYRALPVDAVPEFYQYFLDKQENNRLENALAIEALLFLMLTGARSAEVIGSKAKPSQPHRFIPAATWNQIDFNKRIWTISAERTKAGYDHLVPLSDQAISILKKTRLKSTKTKPTDPIFFSHLNRGGDSQLSNGAIRSQLLKGPKYNFIDVQRYKKSQIIKAVPTAHGLRDTFATFACKAGFDLSLISLQLSHKPKQFKQDTSLETYLSTSLVNERRALVDAWGLYCATGKTPKGYQVEYTPDLNEIFAKT